MTRRQDERELVRRYLLGDLDAERRDEVEERLLTDAELQAGLSAARDELTDEYVFGFLEGRELKLFEESFHATPERLHELRLSRALKRYVVAADEERDVAAGVGGGAPFFLFSSRALVAAAAASLLVVLGYVGWTIYQGRQLQARQAQLNSQRAKVEHDLALLNRRDAPDGGGGRSSIVQLTLSPDIERDPGEERRAIVEAGKEFLRLSLRLREDGSQNCRAVIETEDGARIYSVENLPRSVTDEGAFVNLLLPGRLLATGDYQIRLIGDAGGGNVELGVYPFQVVLR